MSSYVKAKDAIRNGVTIPNDIDRTNLDVVKLLKVLRQDLADNSELPGLEAGIRYSIEKIDEYLDGMMEKQRKE